MTPPPPPPSADDAATTKQTDARWCSYADLPQWMQDNEYIHAFYRPPTFSYRRCIASLGYIHNETGNIYSHAVGALLFLGLTGFTAHMISEQSTANWSDSLVFYVFLSGAIICLGLSATFHLFSCHSEKVSANWNRCDYIGIVALIVGSFYPIVYYAFYCHPVARNVYLAVITGLGALTVTTCISRQFASPAFRCYRAGIFIALGGSGVVPMLHALIQFGWHHIIEGASLPWVVSMGAVYIVGAIIYAARVPERWWPGKFDIFLHSHQIFHLFVITAATMHYVGLVRAFRWHHNMDPFCALR
ncbi:hemolysin-III related-domain-containing protein [Syncephalis pseudoplumigaleata]|uniref:Hemolysin-III related-domain-containing protein n=1 Tax=Syncephalis pseudoplumigaleata TaxID=1712513 RepID=A0A4V1J275_9FUNG|nr:hemolysin-III related-domain-containing protein [Syncephalis pseudoplumigaleata]|eukprot:RKP27579.1 hemolysin-III related-domain-containing protein [Syncephalis pseudoplumigaleata]